MCHSVYIASTHMQLTTHALHHIHTLCFTCGSVRSAYALSLVCFIEPSRAVTAHLQKLLQCPVARFQLYPCMQLAAREAAVDKIWDSAVVESANSLVNFSLCFEEDDGQAGVSAQWHAQGNNTQTHSDVVILCASCLHARIVL